MVRRIVLCHVLIVGLGLAAAAATECVKAEVTLTDQSTITAEILGFKNGKLALRSAKGEETIPCDRIEKITFPTEPPKPPQIPGKPAVSEPGAVTEAPPALPTKEKADYREKVLAALAKLTERGGGTESNEQFLQDILKIKENFEPDPKLDNDIRELSEELGKMRTDFGKRGKEEPPTEKWKRLRTVAGELVLLLALKGDYDKANTLLDRFWSRKPHPAGNRESVAVEPAGGRWKAPVADLLRTVVDALHARYGTATEPAKTTPP